MHIIYVFEQLQITVKKIEKTLIRLFQEIKKIFLQMFELKKEIVAIHTINYKLNYF
jgi:hypothetical protein